MSEKPNRRGKRLDMFVPIEMMDYLQSRAHGRPISEVIRHLIANDMADQNSSMRTQETDDAQPDSKPPARPATAPASTRLPLTDKMFWECVDYVQERHNGPERSWYNQPIIDADGIDNLVANLPAGIPLYQAIEAKRNPAEAG